MRHNFAPLQRSIYELITFSCEAIQSYVYRGGPSPRPCLIYFPLGGVFHMLSISSVELWSWGACVLSSRDCAPQGLPHKGCCPWVRLCNAWLVSSVTVQKPQHFTFCLWAAVMISCEQSVCACRCRALTFLLLIIHPANTYLYLVRQDKVWENKKVGGTSTCAGGYYTHIGLICT